MDKGISLQAQIELLENEIIVLNKRILVLQLENQMLQVSGAALKFYTVEQAAETLQITRSTITRYIQDGRLNAFQTEKGGNYRISMADLMDFIRRNTIDRLEVCEC